MGAPPPEGPQGRASVPRGNQRLVPLAGAKGPQVGKHVFSRAGWGQGPAKGARCSFPPGAGAQGGGAGPRAERRAQPIAQGATVERARPDPGQPGPSRGPNPKPPPARQGRATRAGPGEFLVARRRRADARGNSRGRNLQTPRGVPKGPSAGGTGPGRMVPGERGAGAGVVVPGGVGQGAGARPAVRSGRGTAPQRRFNRNGFRFNRAFPLGGLLWWASQRGPESSDWVRAGLRRPGANGPVAVPAPRGLEPASFLFGGWVSRARRLGSGRGAENTKRSGVPSPAEQFPRPRFRGPHHGDQRAGGPESPRGRPQPQSRGNCVALRAQGPVFPQAGRPAVGPRAGHPKPPCPATARPGAGKNWAKARTHHGPGPIPARGGTGGPALGGFGGAGPGPGGPWAGNWAQEGWGFGNSASAQGGALERAWGDGGAAGTGRRRDPPFGELPLLPGPRSPGFGRPRRFRAWSEELACGAEFPRRPFQSL